MPKTSSGAGNGSASPGTRGRASVRGSMRGTPWEPVVDAMGQAISRFSVDNAMTGVEAMDASGDAIESIGKGFRSIGTRIADEVDWDPRIVPFFETLGDMIVRAAEPARKGAAAMNRAEQERINNVREGGAKRRKWDIGAHD